MPSCDRLLHRPTCVLRGSCWRWHRFAGYKRPHAASRLSGRPLMNAAPTSRPTPVPAPADDTAGVPAAIEHLLKAHDSSSVLEICERILADFGIAGQLHWRAPEAQDTHSAGWRFDLAEDTQRQHVLTLSRDE